jgi:hypothetical protein
LVRLVGEDRRQAQLAERIGRSESLPKQRHFPVFNQHIWMPAVLVQPRRRTIEPVPIEQIESNVARPA